MDTLTLSFDFPSKGSFVYELISAFVLHVLYVRGILPEPCEGLHRAMQAEEAETPTEALKYADRKKRKSIHDVVEALGVIRSVAEGIGIERVAVLLGPSANNPKETYSVEFRSQSLHGDSGLSAKQLNQAKRHLIHKLIEHQSTEDCPPPTNANVFFAVKLADTSAGNANADIMQSEELLRVFSFRESFKVKNDVIGQGSAGSAPKKAFGGRRKAKPLHLRVLSKSATVEDLDGVPAEGEDTNAEAPEQTDDASASGGMWLVLSKGIKNIPA